MDVDIDNKDKKILNLLIDDAKLPYRKIAKKAGVSVATVMNRIKRLEKEGIITKYTIGVKYSKIGYDMQVIIDVRISEGKLKDAEEKIAMHPNVFAVYDNTGQFDATVIAKFKKRSDLDRFLKKIQAYDFVERIETKLLLSTVKEHMIKLPIN
ncbi:MAG: Lrp/AsnC family transcriptional regulator [Candidatus Nanoarchaeia archaeon]|nr:Lrp/AsnC family transcriptional regulator [Candidatus Nanoarchaeia archaeon]